MQLTVLPRDLGAVVMDGQRVVAKALCVSGSRVWRIKAYGWEWLDARAAEASHVTGKCDRRFLVVRTKAQAVAILKDLISST
jgi:hypothetical protein